MTTQVVQPVQARYYLLSGHVQGIGFRPFVYRIAHEYEIKGWVQNRVGQVAIHAEGDPESLQAFHYKLLHRAPLHSHPVVEQSRVIESKDYPSFTILTSSEDEREDIRMIPDLPVCEDCLNEMKDPHDRRFRYPFINCTQCGPRYTLIRKLPYDRDNTTMADFPLCEECAAEYRNPMDRRYHAEPVACAQCGPGLYFQEGDKLVTGNERSLRACVEALKAGKVIAVKGLGGYHLMADACNDEAVFAVRQRKPRPHKPLAVMMTEKHIEKQVVVNKETRQLLENEVHPIVLMTKKHDSTLSELIAPRLNEVGVMQPYSPLHHLLMHDFDGPLVATSANISGEPVLTDNTEVVQRLSKVADAYLHHNRNIYRPADDAVYRIINNKPRIVRLGRGNAPLEFNLPFHTDKPMLAVGGHMKNTVALAWGNRIVISPHIGEMDTLRSQKIFQQVINDLQTLYHVEPQVLVCDAHPQYFTTHYAIEKVAQQEGLQLQQVFHHHAHAACLPAEYHNATRWLVFTWDGTGYGEDETVWGGEALLGNAGQWQRVASMRPFHLPGGDKAGREPWRSAAALCWEIHVNYEPAIMDLDIAKYAWETKVHCPKSTSVGRLFDAAAALLGILDKASFEGQAPMWLEALAEQGESEGLSLEMERDANGIWRTDWHWLVEVLMTDSMTRAERARCFHETMALTLLHQAIQIRDEHGQFAVGLSGGVFQNRLLMNSVVSLLTRHDFQVYIPQMIPVNDGGLCFGQVVEAHAAGRNKDRIEQSRKDELVEVNEL